MRGYGYIMDRMRDYWRDSCSFVCYFLDRIFYTVYCSTVDGDGFVLLLVVFVVLVVLLVVFVVFVVLVVLLVVLLSVLSVG